jgi:hypothetical protein
MKIVVLVALMTATFGIPQGFGATFSSKTFYPEYANLSPYQKMELWFRGMYTGEKSAYQQTNTCDASCGGPCTATNLEVFYEPDGTSGPVREWPTTAGECMDLGPSAGCICAPGPEGAR